MSQCPHLLLHFTMLIHRCMVWLWLEFCEQYCYRIHNAFDHGHTGMYDSHQGEQFLKAYQESDHSMMRRSLGSCRRLHFMQAWHPDLETTTLNIQTQHHNLCIVYFRSAHSAAVFLTRPHDAELRAVFQPRLPASDCSGIYRPLHRAVSWLTVTFSFNA
jgi:hypothetical protein